VVNFVSSAVVSGFTSAAAIVIALSQLKGLLGIEVSSAQSTTGLLLDVGRKLAEANLLTAAVGVGSIAVLLAGRRLAPRFPAPLVVVGLGTLLTYAFGLHEKGLAIVGEVPKGLPNFALPALDGGAILMLLPTALTIAFIGYVEAFAVARSIAAREGYGIEANKEFKGLGLANIAASVFSGYPVTGGFSRSAVNHVAGARTQLSSVVTAVLVLIALAAFTLLFYYLPNAVLSAIVIVAVYGLIDVETTVRLFGLKRADGWTLVVTFAATLAVGVQWGVPIGVAFSLLVFVWRAVYPHTAKLGYLPDKGAFRNLERFPRRDPSRAPSSCASTPPSTSPTRPSSAASCAMWSPRTPRCATSSSTSPA
jgi:SulP family sulfate permease